MVKLVWLNGFTAIVFGGQKKTEEIGIAKMRHWALTGVACLTDDEVAIRHGGWVFSVQNIPH